MSLRREARSRAARPTDLTEVLRAFLVGRCIEVWADPGADRLPQASAMRRFSAARDRWFTDAGLNEAAERRRLIPSGSPWSVEYLSYRGQAERLGRPLAELVAERFAEAGCTLRDLAALRSEADDLWASAQFGKRALRRG